MCKAGERRRGADLDGFAGKTPHPGAESLNRLHLEVALESVGVAKLDRLGIDDNGSIGHRDARDRNRDAGVPLRSEPFSSTN